MTPGTLLWLARSALVCYAVLLAAGGLVGYLKAQSRPSLIAGMASGVAALLCVAATFPVPRAGLIAAALVALALSALFGVRFSRGRKFMPAGLILLASVLLLLLTAATAVQL